MTDRLQVVAEETLLILAGQDENGNTHGRRGCSCLRPATARGETGVRQWVRRCG